LASTPVTPLQLKQFNGLTINLPHDSRYHPDHGNLEWNRREVFRGEGFLNPIFRFEPSHTLHKRRKYFHNLID
jgi:hypothetical protein